MEGQTRDAVAPVDPPLLRGNPSVHPVQLKWPELLSTSACAQITRQRPAFTARALSWLRIRSLVGCDIQQWAGQFSGYAHTVESMWNRCWMAHGVHRRQSCDHSCLGLSVCMPDLPHFLFYFDTLLSLMRSLVYQLGHRCHWQEGNFTLGWKNL